MDFLLALIASIIVSLVSFVGIIVFLSKIYKSGVFTALISFAAGSLIGDVFFHLLPEHIELFGYTNDTVLGLLLGIIIMLLVEAYFHCSHDSSNEISENKLNKDHSHLGKLNIISDALHNFLDGIAIGASFLVSPEVGIATTIAVILHEIPQEFADVSVLAFSGFKKSKILVINFFTALTSVLGVIFVFVLQNINQELEKYLITIAAGQFIYIALADLLPVIHKKSGVKKYLVEIFAFILGIFIMFVLTTIE